MKFINKVIVFVMGLVVIGVATTIISVVTQPRNVEKDVTFELLDNDELAYNVVDKINGYAIYDNNDVAINLVSISVNNDYIFDIPSLDKIIDGVRIFDQSDDESTFIRLIDNSTYTIPGGTIYNVGDVITLTFDVEQETPAIIKTLLFLAPLILSASLISFLAFKKGDE